MKILLFLSMILLSQQEKKITLRFVNENKELIPVFAYWNDYYKIPTKQENISLMRTIKGISPKIVVTKPIVQIYIMRGEEITTITLEQPSGSGTIDIMLPTGKADKKNNTKAQNKAKKELQKSVIQ